MGPRRTVESAREIGDVVQVDEQQGVLVEPPTGHRERPVGSLVDEQQGVLVELFEPPGFKLSFFLCR